MELTPEEAALVKTLCDVAWAAGAVRSEKMGDDLRALKNKVTEEKKA